MSNTYGTTKVEEADAAQDPEGHTQLKHYGLFSWPGGPTVVNFGTDESPKDLIGTSAYAFFLVPNVWSFLLALMVASFQCYLFVILWNDAATVTNVDFRANESDRIAGIVGAAFMLSMRVLPRIGQGMELLSLGLGLTMRRFRRPHLAASSFKEFDVRLVFVGGITLLVLSGCVCTGMRYALNKSASVYRTVTSATVAIVIEGIDESMYSFLKYWSRPSWIQWANASLEKDYGHRHVD